MVSHVGVRKFFARPIVVKVIVAALMPLSFGTHKSCNVFSYRFSKETATVNAPLRVTDWQYP